MATTRVEDLYERQVRPLPLQERLQLAQRIIAEVAHDTEAREQRRSLLELRGLGADLWESQDAQEYVNQLRQEWDERP
jgi:hypothetical protein